MSVLGLVSYISIVEGCRPMIYIVGWVDVTHGKTPLLATSALVTTRSVMSSRVSFPAALISIIYVFRLKSKIVLFFVDIVFKVWNIWDIAA